MTKTERIANAVSECDPMTMGEMVREFQKQRERLQEIEGALSWMLGYAKILQDLAETLAQKDLTSRMVQGIEKLMESENG